MRPRIDIERAQKMASAGMTAPEIARALGVSRAAIYLARNRGDLSLVAGLKGRVPALERDVLEPMLLAGQSVCEIAAATGRDQQTVRNACKKFGLDCSAKRLRPPKVVVRAPTAAPRPVPRPTNPRTDALIATGGRYGDLAAWAAEWGVSETKARQEWHQLRLPVSKGGV